jgi:hypothetical protein
MRDLIISTIRSCGATGFCCLAVWNFQHGYYYWVSFCVVQTILLIRDW